MKRQYFKVKIILINYMCKNTKRILHQKLYCIYFFLSFNVIEEKNKFLL